MKRTQEESRAVEKGRKMTLKSLQRVRRISKRLRDWRVG
jgi:hypothetical protein